MTVSTHLQQARSLINKVSQHAAALNDESLQSLVHQLTTEITAIEQTVTATAEQSTPTSIARPTIDKASGCYQFDSVEGFFCPNCFDKHNMRASTKRLNKNLRVCSECRASIRPSAKK